MEFAVSNANHVSAGLKLRNGIRGDRRILASLGAALMLLFVGGAALAFPVPPFLPAQGSTVPSNGDLVPYGLAVVPNFFPGHTLKPGELLVSNFNNSVADGNLPGQGSTIVIINPANGRQVGLFFEGTPPIGFTNALSIVEGFVFAGSLPTNSSGTNPTSGGLLVLDANGKLVNTITTGIDGAWGLAVNDEGGGIAQLFVSNVLNGTVVRLTVSFHDDTVSVVGSPTTIGSGYAFAPDASALVIGPAGLAYDSATDGLYVAAEGDNEIFLIKNASTTAGAGKGTLVFNNTHLEGPLGLIIAPNGHLITANADPTAFQNAATPSELVEFTKSGKFVREFSIDPTLGAAFAILNVPIDDVDNQFAWVDDVTSSITIVQFPEPFPVPPFPQ